MKFCLSSDVSKHNGSWQQPTWQQVFEKLTILKKSHGCVGLDLLEGNPYGIDTLQVRYDGTRYVLSHLLNTEDDEEVYDFIEPNSCGDPHKLTDVLGDLWSEASVCTDFSYVFKYFKEFWETGKVSLEHFS
ncbi:DUF6911 family protein [Yoonia sp. 2307UL14-13]|uniref:DUF6911 family protein n=1 Tax=Yoonia sp. 2307UL14-13 TaxID=3126506 RepID=UPI0030A511DE